MKRLRLAISFFSTIGIIFFASASLAAPRIAVVDIDTTDYASFSFDSTSGRQSGSLSGELLAEYITDELVNSNLFDVVERSKIKSAINELGFARSGFVDQSSAPKIGKLLGAKYLLTGKVVRLDATEERFVDFGMNMVSLNVQASANIRIVNTQTGSIVFSTRASASKKLKASAYGGGGNSVIGSSISSDLAESLAVDLIEKLKESGKTFP